MLPHLNQCFLTNQIQISNPTSNASLISLSFIVTPLFTIKSTHFIESFFIASTNGVSPLLVNTLTSAFFSNSIFNDSYPITQLPPFLPNLHAYTPNAPPSLPPHSSPPHSLPFPTTPPSHLIQNSAKFTFLTLITLLHCQM